jgi:hypothetical protein
LGQQVDALRRLGYGVAALSYDSPEVLAHFARRKGIPYPLLSDPDSAAIDAFGIRNEKALTGFAKGVPHPGMFIIGADGRIEGKYFEEDYRERITVSSILTGRFGERGAASASSVERPRIRVETSASTAVVKGGQHLRLHLTFTLTRGLHVYAPGAPPEFIPVRWRIGDSPAWNSSESVWPDPEKTALYGAGDKVPNYSGTVRLSRELRLASQQVLQTAAPQGELAVTGEFRYQACDEKVCYPPETVPLSWKLLVESHDRERVPAELQRK